MKTTKLKYLESENENLHSLLWTLKDLGFGIELESYGYVRIRNKEIFIRYVNESYYENQLFLFKKGWCSRPRNAELEIDLSIGVYELIIKIYNYINPNKKIEFTIIENGKFYTKESTIEKSKEIKYQIIDKTIYNRAKEKIKLFNELNTENYGMD